MNRSRGLSVRLKLTLSYAGFLMLAGGLLLAAVWLFLLQYVPKRALINPARSDFNHGVFPVRSNLLHVFAPRAAVVLGILLVVGLVGGWFLAGRMLRPLTRINDAIRTAGTGSLSHRIRLRGRRDEFRELADAFDAMLGQLETHVAEQRRFAANASHELRTPLAITQTLLDVARHDPDRDIDGLFDRLRTVNTRAIDLTEALLLLSRVDQKSFTSEQVDLGLITEEVVESLMPLADKHGVTLETSGDSIPTVGSRALLSQLTTNLVHNAIVHNLPEHGLVWITTSVDDPSVEGSSVEGSSVEGSSVDRSSADGSGADESRVVLTVENTGEVLSPALVSTLAEPFQRGTQRVHRDNAGVGLGLAIVKRIAQAHGGTLNLAPRPAGGLCATVRLPAAG